MGQLFKSFKRYNYRLSNFLNSSKNCSNDSTMTGLKIAIILFAIAMISATANAGCLQNSDCEESHACDTTTNRCYNYRSDTWLQGTNLCVLNNLSNAIAYCNSHSNCDGVGDIYCDGDGYIAVEASTYPTKYGACSWIKN